VTQPNLGGTEEEAGFEFNLKPDRECDLVMKGGITSGVVYPPAVLKLQETFRFRSIGGTSAGAIAAAVTAAAELDREGGGFERLDQLRKELAKPGFLMSLFQPTPETAPAFGILKDLFLQPPPAATDTPEPKGWQSVLAIARRAVQSLARHFGPATTRGRGWGALIGAVPVVLILVGWSLADPLTDLLARPGISVPLGLIAIASLAVGGLVGGALSGAIAFLRTFTHHLPREGHFGLCRGYNGGTDPGILTSWLAGQIDWLAGRGEKDDPVTFADLAEKRDARGEPIGISLRMVTTNLSHGQPYVFPREGDIFLFNEEEMSRFFPPRIVSYLKRAGGTAGLPLPPGYYFLPKEDKLPVVFATRLSLSFPILLSAVRLYTIKAAAFGELRRCEKAGIDFAFDAGKHLQENWFSDGGICSNFPIHFFDSWLPSRPTFGINLSDVPESAKVADDKIGTEQFSAIPVETAGLVDVAQAPIDVDGDDDGVDDVFLPHPREGARGMAQWNPVSGLGGFLMSAFDSARNYRDTMQSMLPSYRERIVQVRLTSREGGLNLAMQPETIRRIGAKGRRAGELLTSMDFAQHQWVRLRVLMAYLEKGIGRMRENFPLPDRYRALFDQQLSAGTGGTSRGGRWYKPKDAAWCDKAMSRMEAIHQLAELWRQQFFGVDPPRPEASLRVTPPL
jgi:predicted acylesterase/phospholipase RssA